MSDIEAILKSKGLKYMKRSSTMYCFYSTTDPKTIVGSLSITEGDKILCRFYYKTVELSHVKTFFYDSKLFDKEFRIANNNYFALEDKRVKDIMEGLLNDV